MKVITNNQAREMIPFDDLPLKVQADFDYVEGEDRFSYRFVSYRGCFYDVYDTQVINVAPTFSGFGCNVQKEDPLAKWHSVISESYFSGVVFKLANDESVICGSYTS